MKYLNLSYVDVMHWPKEHAKDLENSWIVKDILGIFNVTLFCENKMEDGESQILMPQASCKMNVPHSVIFQMDSVPSAV